MSAPNSDLNNMNRSSYPENNVRNRYPNNQYRPCKTEKEKCCDCMPWWR